MGVRISEADLARLRNGGSGGPGEASQPAAGPRGGSAALIAGRAERRDPGTGLNRTEEAFRVQALEPLRLGGLILRYDNEPEGLRVGLKGTKAVYWPDWRVVWADQVIEFLEVKGQWLDDARAKIKAAAALHPYTFRAVQRRPGGGWSIETIGPWPSWEERIAALQ